MESLAYIHNAIAYEDPKPSPIITLWQRFNGQKRPSSGWLKFLWIGAIVAAVISLGEAAHAATVKIKTNSGNGVNVRVQPTASATPIGGLGEGTIIEVADSNTSGWYMITSGTYKDAYIDSQWTVPILRSDDPMVGVSTGKMKVRTNSGVGLNIRSLPTFSSSIVGVLNQGEEITAMAGETPGWSRITEGPFAGKYISSNWLVSTGTSPDPIGPVSDPATETTYVIKTNSGIGVKVRALPTTASGNIGGLGEGEKVRAKASRTPGWLQVTSGSYQGGYVASPWAVPSSGVIDAVDPGTGNSSGNYSGNYTVRTNSGIGVIVRSSPTTASGNIGGFGEGSVVNATSVGNGWLQITSGSYVGGYISGNWAVAGGSGGTTNVSNPPSYGTGNYVVDTNGGGLIVRSTPSTAARSIGGLGDGQRVSAVASDTAGWLVINSGPYAGGYISSTWVAPANNVASF